MCITIGITSTDLQLNLCKLNAAVFFHLDIKDCILIWLAVLKAQRDLGIDLPNQVVDISSIAERKRVLRHEVKARISWI